MVKRAIFITGAISLVWVKQKEDYSTFGKYQRHSTESKTMCRWIAIFIVVLSGANAMAQPLPCSWHNPLHTSLYLRCHGEQVNIVYVYQGATYVWSTGDSTNAIQITTTGHYWVDITKDGCTMRDSMLAIFSDPAQVYLGPDTTICEGQTIQLSAGSPTDYTYYLWNNNETNPSIHVNAAGTYWVEVSNGCEVYDTIQVSIRERPEFEFGPDKFVCTAGGIWLNPQVSDASFLWQDGSVAGNFYATQPGLYHLTATNNCGIHSDSVHLIPVDPPVFDLGADTNLCVNQTTTLQLPSPILLDTYQWSTGSTNSFLVVNKPGSYWLKVERAGCTLSDTIRILYTDKPQFSLSADKVICEGDSLRLHAGITGASFLWSDGSQLSSFTAFQPGKYYLEATNICGSMADTIFLKPGLCRILMPSAFTPNGDGKNDLFRIPAELGLTIDEFSIYNRWGEKIFTTSDIAKGWDGRIRSKLASQGVYIYFIRAKSNNEDLSAANTFVLIR